MQYLIDPCIPLVLGYLHILMSDTGIYTHLPWVTDLEAAVDAVDSSYFSHVYIDPQLGPVDGTSALLMAPQCIPPAPFPSLDSIFVVVFRFGASKAKNNKSAWKLVFCMGMGCASSCTSYLQHTLTDRPTTMLCLLKR